MRRGSIAERIWRSRRVLSKASVLLGARFMTTPPIHDQRRPPVLAPLPETSRGGPAAPSEVERDAPEVDRHRRLRKQPPCGSEVRTARASIAEQAEGGLRSASQAVRRSSALCGGRALQRGRSASRRRRRWPSPGWMGNIWGARSGDLLTVDHTGSSRRTRHRTERRPKFGRKRPEFDKELAPQAHRLPRRRAQHRNPPTEWPRSASAARRHSR